MPILIVRFDAGLPFGLLVRRRFEARGKVFRFPFAWFPIPRPGGVNLTLPVNYAANIVTGTVNGGFKSDIPSLNITTEDVKGESYGHARAKTISTSINGGGAPVRIVTTNGGVRINSAENE